MKFDYGMASFQLSILAEGYNFGAQIVAERTSKLVLDYRNCRIRKNDVVLHRLKIFKRGHNYFLGYMRYERKKIV